jgi:hypothetical protein
MGVFFPMSLFVPLVIFSHSAWQDVVSALERAKASTAAAVAAVEAEKEPLERRAQVRRSRRLPLSNPRRVLDALALFL